MASDSDSDSGLPEIISFSTSASLAKGHDHALRSFHAVDKRKTKERNRQHDERLKAQAIMRRRVTTTTRKDRLYVGNHEVETGDSGSGSDLDPRLHWRMTRAMDDAKEETEGESAGAEEWGGINATSREGAADQDVEMSRSEGAEETEEKSRNGDLYSSEAESDDDGGLGVLGPQAPAGKYLPDHIFIAAWSKSKPENEMRLSQTTLRTRSSRKRQLRARATDVVVGTRTVRTLLSSPASVRVQSQGTTSRPARIDKFLTNALGLEGKNKKISPRASRWERRPSHLGVMKRTAGAPVTGFARPS